MVFRLSTRSGLQADAFGSQSSHEGNTRTTEGLIALLAPGAKADSLPLDIWNGARPEKWRRLHPDKPAYTILAQMHRDLSEWVHPDHERWITVREAARLQSFHDGFVFKSSEWQMLKQIGNAVPPLLARALASAAETVLEKLDHPTTMAAEPPYAQPLPLSALDAPSSALNGTRVSRRSRRTPLRSGLHPAPCIAPPLLRAGSCLRDCLPGPASKGLGAPNDYYPLYRPGLADTTPGTPRPRGVRCRMAKSQPRSAPC